MTIYGPYATVYDASGQTAFSLRMIAYLEQLLERHPVAKGNMLDLACGTGTVAVAMASYGWRTYGVDASPEMLAVARSKAEASGVDVAWSRQDMRHLVLPEPMMLVTCLYDSLNYMPDLHDLGAAMRAVAGALAPGGLFICDVSTPTALEQWANRTFFSESDNLAMIHCCRPGTSSSRLVVDITGFALVNDGLYRRFSEKHEQWAASVSEMRSVLRSVGLTVEGCYECFTLRPCGPESVRCAWVVRKPSDPGSPRRPGARTGARG